jgi:hypothetical protein
MKIAVFWDASECNLVDKYKIAWRRVHGTVNRIFNVVRTSDFLYCVYKFLSRNCTERNNTRIYLITFHNVLILKVIDSKAFVIAVTTSGMTIIKPMNFIENSFVEN